MSDKDKVSFTNKSGREIMVNKTKGNIKAARAAGWKETVRMNAQKDNNSTETSN